MQSISSTQRVPTVTRIVGVGTKDKLWTPSTAQLAEKDWDNSYLKRANISGLTIPPMWNASVVDCRATKTVFQNVDLSTFRRSIDLSGATIPKMISSLNHDLVREVIRQGAAASTGPAKDLLTWTADYIDPVKLGIVAYENSWGVAIWKMVNELKLTREQVREYLTRGFAEYPRLMNRLDKELRGELSPDLPTYGKGDLNPKVGVTVDESQIKAMDTEDRWAAARMTEQYLNHLSGVEWQVQVFTLDPYVFPVARVKLDDTKVWWHRSMGI